MDNYLTILLYHGVTSFQSKGIENYSKKHIDVADFEHQMKYINKHCTILSMDEVEYLISKKVTFPDNAVAVTFDDGFRNNLKVAAPILEAYDIPCTFYITSGIINTDMMFWVDQLEDCINYAESNLIKIKLEKEYTFTLKNNEDKIFALTTIKSFCKKQSKKIKNAIIDQVLSETKVVPAVEHSENYKKLSWDEVKKLSGNKNFIIGGHSLYHDVLSSIEDPEKLESDIQLSIKLLEYHIEKKITHYSYPEGQQNHYNSHVIEILKSHGIKCCPSAIHGVNGFLEYDPFNLRRIMVGFNGTPFPFEN